MTTEAAATQVELIDAIVEELKPWSGGCSADDVTIGVSKEVELLRSVALACTRFG
jgi:hypothetical protein